jgi:hypothetical protein
LFSVVGFLMNELEQIGELRHVLVIRDPIVLEHVAEVPQLANDVVGVAVGGGACGHHQASRLSSSTRANAAGANAVMHAQRMHEAYS